MKKITFLIILTVITGFSQKTGGIKTGVFELYENNVLIGKIYRLGNYQIEKYLNNEELIARIDHVADSAYLLRGIEKNPQGKDSIIWLNKYKKIARNNYKITAEPFNVKIDYTYEAILLKVEEEIDNKNLERLNSLNKNDDTQKF